MHGAKEAEMSETDSITVIKSEGVFKLTFGGTSVEQIDWDLAGAVTQPPVKNRRSVVSVAFPSEQFQAVARAAREQGKKLSAFIREAAMRAVEP